MSPPFKKGDKVAETKTRTGKENSHPSPPCPLSIKKDSGLVKELTSVYT